MEQQNVKTDKKTRSESDSTPNEGTAVHVTKVPVRWADFDRFGHLTNSAYVEVAQEARLQWAYQEFVAKGHEIPAVFVRKITADYEQPILPSTVAVEVETMVVQVGNSSFTTRQKLKDEHGRTACVVECVQIAIDLKTASPRAIESHEKKVLTRGSGSGVG